MLGLSVCCDPGKKVKTSRFGVAENRKIYSINHVSIRELHNEEYFTAMPQINPIKGTSTLGIVSRNLLGFRSCTDYNLVLHA